MESAIKVSQINLIKDEYDHKNCRTTPDSIYKKLWDKVVKNEGELSDEEWIFMAREIPHLRTAYGVYLTNCQKEKVEKPITWRTFYMQCRGLRTLKPNTIQALSDYIRLIDEQHSKGYVSRCINE